MDYLKSANARANSAASYNAIISLIKKKHSTLSSNDFL